MRRRSFLLGSTALVAAPLLPVPALELPGIPMGVRAGTLTRAMPTDRIVGVVTQVLEGGFANVLLNNRHDPDAQVNSYYEDAYGLLPGDLVTLR